MDNTGLYINKADFCLDKAKSEKHELKLLASGDGVEVMAQEIEAGIMFEVYPAEDESTLMEFFYVLDGELQYLNDENNPLLLSRGDYFYAKKLKINALFKAVTKVRLIYVSTQPIFQYIGESIMELHKINKEIDEKDKYTHSHSERVRDYAVKIAIELGLNRERMAALAIAALFHDVGKIYINDDILKKQEELTIEEYELVKQHPLNSAHHVKNIKYVDVANIVKQHHERLDGSGYPDGLKGNEICLEAKIIAVADTFDAMTTDRPYRKASSYEEAIAEMENLAGVYFDCDAVEALAKTLKMK